jgi:hypothetical protein
LPSVHKGDLPPEEQGNPRSKEYNMENERPWIRAQVLANVIVAFFTAALFFVAYWQYRLYVLNERPWVGPVRRTVSVDKTNGKFIELEWWYTNGGKSVARNLRFDLSLKIGPPLKIEVSAIEAPVADRCHKPESLPGMEGFTDMPGAEQVYLSATPQEVLDSGESIVANRIGLYFVGCLDYEDTSGQNHRTNVCEFFFPSAHIFMACARGNGAS